MVKLTLFDVGYCTEPEFVMIQGGSRQRVKIPVLAALVEHPDHGLTLYDTGYSFRFFELTQRFPYSLYAKITPVTLREEDLLVNKLRSQGITPEDIETILVSHFHPDHIGALRDFPNASFVYFEHGYDAVRQKSGVRALLDGFFPDMLPDDFEMRSKPITEEIRCQLSPGYTPFEVGYDLLGDGSLLAVDLPGHAVGQMGVFAQTEGETYFLIADASWLSRSFRENIMPNRVASLLFSSWPDAEQTQTLVYQLHNNRPDIHIIPTHCPETAEHFSRQ